LRARHAQREHARLDREQAAAEEWDGAAAIVSRLATLPDSHGQAVQRLWLSAGPEAYGPWPSAEHIKASLGPRPQSHHPTLPAAGAWEWLTPLATTLDTVMPPLSECSPVGASLTRGAVEDIEAAAQEAAETARAYYADRDRAGQPTAPGEETWTRAERLDPRWQKRRLRRESRRAQAWYDAALRMTGPHSPAVSGYTLGAARETWDRGRMWSADMTVLFEDGTTVPLSTIQSHARSARRAQLYTVAKAMEFEGERRDFTAFFITLTLPGEYHPFTTGKLDKNGHYPNARPNPNWNPAYGPAAQWAELQGRWATIRGRLADHVALREWWGISVPEPHQDGTPHLHIMVWMPRSFEQRGMRRTAHVLRDILRDVAPDRQGRLEIVRKRVLKNGKTTGASPASYVMKYVMMSLDDEATQAARGEDAERHRAWASTRGLRRMRLVGVHGSLRIWQRLWTAREDEYDTMPPTAQTAWDYMRRSEVCADEADAMADTPWEREIPAMRRRQAEAAADALREIGGLPGGERRLKLGYEESETEYGRPSRKPATITEEAWETVDEEYVTPKRRLRRVRKVTKWRPTGGMMPLRKQAAELVPTEVIEKVENRNSLTVVAICPRDAADAAPPVTTPADPDDLAHADDLDRLIRNRAGKQIWQEWCERMRHRVENIRTGRPANENGDKETDEKAA
jgi:hypothetical protein